MPTKNPRIHVVLDKPLYETVCRLAEEEDISLSLKVRDLVKKALESEEDTALGEFAQEREKTFRRAKGLTHKQVWGP